jgi:hypothetical protein
MVRRIPAPDCLGKIAASYGDHCSEVCPLTALCVLVAMGDYLRQSYRVPPSQEMHEDLK